MPTYITHDEPVLIWTGKVMLDGRITIPPNAPGVVVVAGLGGTLHHGGYRSIAGRLSDNGMAVIMADLLTPDEQQFDARTGHFRVDLPFLAHRVADIVQWIERHAATRDLPVAYVGSGAAGSAGLLAAAKGLELFGLVLNAARLDLIADVVVNVSAPMLLLVDDTATASPASLGDADSKATIVRLEGAAGLVDDGPVADAVGRHAVKWLRQRVPILATT